MSFGEVDFLGDVLCCVDVFCGVNECGDVIVV